MDDILPTSKRSTTNELILLVDDEQSMQQLGKHLLEYAGYRVIVANNGAEAVDIYRAHKEEIDLVVLDLRMPVMDGGRAYLEMKKIDSSIRAFFCTGYNPDGIVTSLMAQQHLRALHKPFKPVELVHMVREVLDEEC